MPWALQVLAKFLPLTYVVEGLRNAFLGPSGAMLGSESAVSSAAVPVDALVLLGFALASVFPGMRFLPHRFD